MRAPILKVNIDNYHFAGVEDFFFILFFLDHAKELLDVYSSRVIDTHSFCTSRSSSLMILAFFLSLGFFFFIEAVISSCTFRAARVAFCLTTLATAHSLCFQTPLFLNIVHPSSGSASSSLAEASRLFPSRAFFYHDLTH